MDSSKKNLSEEHSEILSDELCNLRDTMTDLGANLDAVNRFILEWVQDEDDGDEDE